MKGPKEKTWVTETDPETGEVIYTITCNRERTKYYLNDRSGIRLHQADTPLKFEKDIARLRRAFGRK